MRYLRKNGWLKLYRSDAAFDATERERDYATELGLTHRALSRRRGARARAVARAGVPPRGALAGRRQRVQSAGGDARLCGAVRALGGVMLKGDARTLHRAGDGWRVDTDEGPLDARTRWWRSGRGRRMCWSRSASSCRSRSSAAITGTSVRTATPG